MKKDFKTDNPHILKLIHECSDYISPQCAQILKKVVDSSLDEMEGSLVICNFLAILTANFIRSMTNDTATKIMLGNEVRRMIETYVVITPDKIVSHYA